MTKEQIKEGLDKAYREAGHNAYFGNGFEAGIKFALNAQKTAHNSDYAKCPECGGDMTCLIKHCPICLHEWQ